MRKAEVFDTELQELACFAKVISHPARLAILKYLAETKTCISGDISDQLPLSRTTVSQHLKELREIGLIHELFDTFFGRIKSGKISCGVEKSCK